jgi:hypothetical protein
MALDDVARAFSFPDDVEGCGKDRARRRKHCGRSEDNQRFAFQHEVTWASDFTLCQLPNLKGCSIAAIAPSA